MMAPNNGLHCLVVDDEPRLRRVLVRLLEGDGFICREAGSGVEALEALEKEPVPLMLSDVRMPLMDGVALLREVTHRWPDTAVVMVTAVADVDSAVNCLQLGALDYVAKPFHLDEVRARVTQALDKRRLLLENKNYHRQLEERVEVQARRLEEMFLEGVEMMADAQEAKDPYLQGHSLRVAEYATRAGAVLGLDQAQQATLFLGGRLHDVGKIGVREEVLHKPGKLTDEEYRHIMSHPVVGARMLARMLRDEPTALAIVRSHHERFDGKGLPDGLEGDQIALPVRLVSVADSFDAMTSARPYRPPLPVAHAIDELNRMSGKQFWPDAVKAFLTAFPDASRLPIPTPSPAGGNGSGH
ncbi:MAG TPA: HD domain-containing phosphohydrolase [Gemmatimonadales bacterium]|jgi:response regulator RpfG family c-di-GMP phosphodiesterase|nr:HD domain-containing phosphohydrolase [Gemmatimonadales bacterium]